MTAEIVVGPGVSNVIGCPITAEKLGNSPHMTNAAVPAGAAAFDKLR